VTRNGNARDLPAAGAKEIVGPDQTVPRAAAGSGPDPRGPYGVILRRTWERADWRALSFHARALFLYLRTCPVGGLLGIFRFHPDDAVDDFGFPADAVAPALDELAREGWIRREGRWIWVIDSFATTPGVKLTNRNHRAAVQKALALVPKGLAHAWTRTEGFDPIADDIRDLIPDPIGDPIANGNADRIADHGDGDGDGRPLSDLNAGETTATARQRAGRRGVAR
jgi:hypothetical protein